MANRRNIRKRQFDASKSLRLYRDYAQLYQYLNGDNANEDELRSFEGIERFENKDKIAEMFCKKKQNVVIPEINISGDKDKNESSEKSAQTDVTKELLKNKEEDRPPIVFNITPMGPAPLSYIKYKPRMTAINGQQNYDKIDYMMVEDQWEEIKNSSKSITESMKDLTEEMIDKLEKFTEKGEVQQLERCRDFVKQLVLLSKAKFPTDAQFRAIYNAWVSLRKKRGNAIMRIFWRKPDPNDSSATASFRSRVPEKMQTRRKNKNDQSNYMKLKILRKEIYNGRQLLWDVKKREKLKMAQIELDYCELKQKLREKTQPSYQCDEFKDFLKNEDKIHPEMSTDLAEQFRPEEEEEEKEAASKSHSQFDEESIKSSKYGNKKRSVKDNAIDRSSALGPELSVNSENYSQIEQPTRMMTDDSLRMQNPVSRPAQRHPIHEKAVVDPTTVMQIAIMYKKLHYFGMQVDRSRIKISTHKAIKKEDYLNLPQNEIEKEQYYRAGIKPKSLDENFDKLTGIKYTIYKARNGRVMILRKTKGGKYTNNFKRFKMSESDEFEGARSSFTPVLQNDVNSKFSDFCNLDNTDSDENMSDEETNDNEVDDYTDGFVQRFRKRKGKKRGTSGSDHIISFKINGP
jgi:hypothetical protein